MTVLTQEQRLKVLIVGAGLCGLTAAVGLRAIADVLILEQTSSLRELGAAVSLAPNAHRILRQLGVEPMKRGAVACERFQEYSAETGALELDRETAKADVEMALCHRQELQKELLEAAIDPAREGRVAEVLFGQTDPDAGTVTTSDGRVFSADAIVGADGIKSAVRRAVVGDVRSVASGHSAYRGLIPRAAMDAVPELRELNLTQGRMVICNGGDRRVVTYPTRRGELLNFVAIMRAYTKDIGLSVADGELSELSEEKWSARGDVARMVASHAQYPAPWRALLGLADACGLWQLRDQDPLPTWVRGRAIVVGDAAHAMLPYQGAGAGQAIEDAEALTAILAGASAAEVPKALDRVFRIRYKRATYAQESSRATAHGAMREEFTRKLGRVDVAGLADPFKYMIFQWGYPGAIDFERTHPEWILGEGERT